MSENSPLSSSNDIEARITALLLGELSADEEVSLRANIAKDPSLLELQNRLSRTIGLIEEAASSLNESSTESADLPKLSQERRERLLKSFKVIHPEELTNHRGTHWGELAAVAAMITVLFFVADWLVLDHFGARQLVQFPERRETEHLSELSRSYTKRPPTAVAISTKDRMLADTKWAEPRDARLAGTPLAKLAEEPPAPPALTVNAPADDNAVTDKFAATRARENQTFVAQSLNPDPSGLPGVYLRRSQDSAGEIDSLARQTASAKNAFGVTIAEGGKNTSKDERGIVLPELAQVTESRFGQSNETSLPPATQPGVAPYPGSQLRSVGIEPEKWAQGLGASAGRAGAEYNARSGIGTNRFFESNPSSPTELGQKSLHQVIEGNIVTPNLAFTRSAETELLGDVIPNKSDRSLRAFETDLYAKVTVDRDPIPSEPLLAPAPIQLASPFIPLPPGIQRTDLAKRELREQIPTGPEKPVDLKVKILPLPLAETKAQSIAPKSESALAASLVEQEKSRVLDREVDVPRRPAPASLPQPEIRVTANPFSTFSLNVSDVSFKLAAASLKNGQMPDPATVRSEEFINAFDYRDPQPRGNTPVAFAWERARDPFAQDRELLRFSLKTAASGRQPSRPLNLVLLLDNSGSMERADRVRIIQQSLRVLAGQLQAVDRVSVVTFARVARLLVDGLPGNQANELLERIDGLPPQGGTNLEEALGLAYQTAFRHFDAKGLNRVVVLTDGAANLGDLDPESLKKTVETHRRQGIALDCFGIGWDGLNDDLLETLSRHGDGRYGFINTPEAAENDFADQLAGALKIAASDVKVQVEWNPRRVTTYRQIGYAKHQLKQEEFRDDTVDAAEIGAAETGNALYIAQVIAGGEGPLATVRVRFKDPSTNEYHEHEWSVAYEGMAKPLEQSQASMRLAATASAFSEWLVSSPYATEVTPDLLLNYLSGVPETWPADSRPKQLEWMIRQAKSLSGK